MSAQSPVSEGMGGPALGLQGRGEGLQERALDLLWREAPGLDRGPLVLGFLVFVFSGDWSSVAHAVLDRLGQPVILHLASCRVWLPALALAEESGSGLLSSSRRATAALIRFCWLVPSRRDSSASPSRWVIGKVTKRRVIPRSLVLMCSILIS